MNADEQRMAAALAPFGWTCGPDFWERYYTDAWVFNLANAVERLSERVDALAAVSAGRGEDVPVGRRIVDPLERAVPGTIVFSGELTVFDDETVGDALRRFGAIGGSVDVWDFQPAGDVL